MEQVSIGLLYQALCLEVDTINKNIELLNRKLDLIMEVLNIPPVPEQLVSRKEKQ